MKELCCLMTLVATVIVASDKMILSLHHTDLELAPYMSSVRDNQLRFRGLSEFKQLLGRKVKRQLEQPDTFFIALILLFTHLLS